MNLFALIVAGGSGRRYGSEIPKQFVELAGKPVLMHTIEKFKSFNENFEIIVVLPRSQKEYWEELTGNHSFLIKHTIVHGGGSRFHSVKNGLDLISGEGLVAIHDGVRPLVSVDTIARCIRTAQKYGNAVPVINPTDSLRIVTEHGTIPLNRLDARIIQTPQVFNTKLIKKAYLQDYSDEFTDDATVLEKTGEIINLVEGNRENIKITTQQDLVISEALLPVIS
jgi:2-C-methyl-D-erythritol 4-phosphate cytidylyltransferase